MWYFQVALWYFLWYISKIYPLKIKKGRFSATLS